MPSSQIFQHPQAQTLISYIRDEYGGELEFLWADSPDTAVWRHPENHKWYGIIFALPARKLSLDSDDLVDVANFKLPPDMIADLIDHEHFFEGYHMNKTHWLTIKLDGTVPTDQILTLLDISYRLTLPRSMQPHP